MPDMVPVLRVQVRVRNECPAGFTSPWNKILPLGLQSLCDRHQSPPVPLIDRLISFAPQSPNSNTQHQGARRLE